MGFELPPDHPSDVDAFVAWLAERQKEFFRLDLEWTQGGREITVATRNGRTMTEEDIVAVYGAD